MTTPEQHANIVRSLKGRLYAALGHEKSCVCGECSGGLNAVDDLAALANRADTLKRRVAELEAALRVVAIDLRSRRGMIDRSFVAGAIEGVLDALAGDGGGA